MKGTDKFLVGIVAGVLFIVIAAVVVVVRRPPPSYKEENTAEGTAHNYLLALQQQDYSRAYTYISFSLQGYQVLSTPLSNKFAATSMPFLRTMILSRWRSIRAALLLVAWAGCKYRCGGRRFLEGGFSGQVSIPPSLIWNCSARAECGRFAHRTDISCHAGPKLPGANKQAHRELQPG